jgi:hypothetical protein
VSKVRRGARWALGTGAALIAIAAVSRAGADVVPIDLEVCSASCLAPGISDGADDEDESANDMTVSLFGVGGTRNANGARPDLVLDPRALPRILLDGLPSSIAYVGAKTLESPSVSPYAFFKEVVDIPLPIDPETGLAAAYIQLFTPSTIGRLTLTDFLSNSNELFKQPPRPAM